MIKRHLKHQEKAHRGTTTREQKLDLSLKEFDEINNYCKSLKINWFASAWDIKSLNF